MIYEISINKLSQDIEEEIFIQINGINIDSFVTHWGSDIRVGRNYKANIGVTILDEIIMYKYDGSIGITQIDNSFAYTIKGRFNYDDYTINCGIIIKIDREEVDLSDFAYLDNQNVLLQVDRITIDFVD